MATQPPDRPDGPSIASLAPGLRVTPPTAFQQRAKVGDVRKLLTGLSGAVVNYFAGNLPQATLQLAQAATALGLKDVPEERAWLLLTRTLMATTFALAAEQEIEFLEGLPPKWDWFEGRFADALEKQEVRLRSNFLTDPGSLPLLKHLERPFAVWLRGCGRSKEAARAIANRLSFYFVLVLPLEWQDHADFYQPVAEALQLPVGSAAEREWAWHVYTASLKQRLAEPLFDEPFSLLDVYVPLRAWIQESRPNRLASHAEIIEQDEPQRRVVDVMTALCNWVQSGDRRDALRVISGGPGSGKSSFLRMFAAQVASDGLASVLLIPLQYFDPRDDLERAVAEFVRGRDLGLRSPLNPQEMPRRLMLLFDGLDELASQGAAGADIARRFVEHVYRILDSRNDQGLRLQIVITSRRLASQAGDFRVLSQLYHLLPYLVPSSEGQQYDDPDRLLEQDQRDAWWQRYGRVRGKDYQGLPAELRDRADLQEITGEPLLNYLLARLWERGGIDLREVDNRNQIYAMLLREVYDRPWGSDRHPGVGKVSFEVFQRVLEEIALVVWQGNGRTATCEAIQERCQASRLTEGLEEFLEQGAKGLTRLLMAFYFHERSIGPTAGSTIEFTHKSFGEYLTARRIVTGLGEMAHSLGQMHGIRRTEGDALAYWARLCGPAQITIEIVRFLRDEVRLQRREAAILWQRMLASLEGVVLRDGMPMEQLGLRTYREMEQQARHAEVALLASLDACARVTEECSRIEPLKEPSFHAWIARLQGNAIMPTITIFGREREAIPIYGEGNLALDCLTHLDLTQVPLLGINLSCADLRGSILRDVFMSGSSLAMANLSGANLEGAILHGGVLWGAQLTGANLAGASLIGAVLYDTDLTGANLMQTQLTGARYNQWTRWPEDFHAEEHGAVLIREPRTREANHELMARLQEREARRSQSIPSGPDI